MLAHELQRLRLSRGMTLQQISDLSGVSVSAVSRIFSGSSDNPSFKAVSDIVITLGGSLDEIVGIKTGDSIAPVPSEASHTVELIRSFYTHQLADKEEQVRRCHKEKEVLYVSCSAMCAALVGLFFALLTILM